MYENDVVNELIKLVNASEVFMGAESFENAGLLSSNEGLVITSADGVDYQLTVVES